MRLAGGDVAPAAVIPAVAPTGRQAMTWAMTSAGPGPEGSLASVAGHRPSLVISVLVRLVTSLIRSARAKSR